MYFRKQPYRANFEFLTKGHPGKPARIGKETYDLSFTAFRDDVYRLRITHPKWSNKSQAGLTPPPRARKDNGTVQLKKNWALDVRAPDGTLILASQPQQAFGVCGVQSMFTFIQADDHQFYGMGEKMLGLELSGKRTKCWNTDVFADFHFKEIESDRPDPMYVSIPYLIVKRGNHYSGLLLDNPYATFLSTSAPVSIGGGQMMLSNKQDRYLAFGAEHGQPDLYIIVGPSLPELTRKLQQLVGRTPMPPAWALGYQQCRWGYRSEADLNRIDEALRQYKIPCDGIWLDIEYMRGYRVFTFDKNHFPNVKRALQTMKKRGRKVVPIIDPGVKQEPGYSVYESGRKAKTFCQSAQGKEFVGMVWPGETVFPDFSTPNGRRWWAKQVKAFARQGLYGAWLDMNDPSTGHVDPTAMRFNQGKESHYTFHNQYGMGMARASREGFAAAHPNQRPFLLTRSAYTGVAKYAAVWTGDNVSNYHYLRNTIAVSINLALSGVPFNGPDIGGFARSTTGPLLRDWMKAGFLFPFCRNHTELSACDQEPWVFGAIIRDIVKHYIQLRYKFRPYLYNLFVHQSLSGEAIMRPLFYDFDDTEALPLGHIDDQFLCGSALMHAPLLKEHQTKRSVVLPGDDAWYAPLAAGWLPGNQIIEVETNDRQTPLFFREGQWVPMHPGNTLPTDNAFDGAHVDFHLFLRATSEHVATLDYYFDDGETLAYEKGKRSHAHLQGQINAQGALEIDVTYPEKGYGPLKTLSVVVYDDFPAVYINGRKAKKKASRWMCAGSAIKGSCYTI